MKRITLLLATVFMAVGMNAQVTLYEENFDSYSPTPHTGEGTELPTDYTSYDVDGDGLNWGLADPLGWIQDLSSIYTSIFMASVSFHSGPDISIDADNIMVLPLISIPSGASDVDLIFYRGSGVDASYFAEYYEVIVTNENDQATILSTTPIYSETLPAVGGDYKLVSLDDFIGQDIYISFRHDTFDNWILGIDDISVTAGSLSNEDYNINGFNFFYSAQTKNLTISANDAFSHISIFNVLGQDVISKGLSSNNEVISLASLNNGVYVAKATANGQTVTFKVVKR